MLTPLFTKEYETPAAAVTAARHHKWLAAHAQALRLPPLREVGPTSLTFENIEGRHAQREDLPRLVRVLGDAHGEAWARSLYRADLATPYCIDDGNPLDDFLTCRRTALRRRLEQGFLPDQGALHAMLKLLERNADGPAAFYKDCNPRNFLFAEDGTPYTVDTDDLTLAPFGYDLAKLIVTLTMTDGPLRPDDTAEALDLYNEAACRHAPQLGATTRQQFDDFLALHVVLTAPYAGRHGYRWPYENPCATTADPRRSAPGSISGRPTWCT